MQRILISADKVADWSRWIRQCGIFDSYHTPEYHRAIAFNVDGEPNLFIYEDDGHIAALPFLTRKLSSVKGLEEEQGFDAVSCYGYPGLLCNITKGHVDAGAFVEGFQSALRETFNEMGIVSFFGRQNPLISTGWMWSGLGEVGVLGNTVAVALDQSDDAQRLEMSKGHRYDIRKARRDGVVVWEDTSFSHLDRFIEIYEETMREVNAEDFYFFSPEYYRLLKSELGGGLRLYFAERENDTVSASMFLVSKPIVQYHLSGTPRQFFPFSGAKVILDEVRSIFSRQGFRWLHLGGG